MISLLIGFLLLLAGKCFTQSKLPVASQNYTVSVLIQPDKANYALRLEVNTDAEITISLLDAHGAPLAALLQKTDLHAGVYHFDLKDFVSQGAIYFLNNGNENLLKFEVPGHNAAWGTTTAEACTKQAQLR